MSEELTTDFDLPTAALTSALMACTLGVLAFGALLLPAQIAIEQRRQATEVKLAVARRLRYIGTGATSSPPKAAHFLLFHRCKKLPSPLKAAQPASSCSTCAKAPLPSRFQGSPFPRFGAGREVEVPSPGQKSDWSFHLFLSQ